MSKRVRRIHRGRPGPISPGARPPKIGADPQRLSAAFPLGEYLLPARDATGGHVAMNTVTMPAHLRVASRLISQALFGFENSADVMRWCLQYGLDELARRSKDPEIMAVMHTLKVWLIAQQVELEHARYFSYFQRVEDGVDRLSRAGHESRAEVLAERVWTTSDRLGSPYWQKKFRAMAYGKKTELERARRRVEEDDEDESE